MHSFVLLERAIKVAPELLKLEQVFADYQKNKYSKIEFKKEFNKILGSFTNQKVNSYIINHYNVMVLPVYTTLFESSDFKKFKDKYESHTGVISNNKILHDIQNIESFNIYIGQEILDGYDPKELTAIILHELGHVYMFTSEFINILETIFGFVRRFSYIYTALQYFIYHNPPFWILLFGVFLLNKTFGIINEDEEYKSDSFSTKFGYGDDLYKALVKIHKYGHGTANLKDSLPKKIIQFVLSFIFVTTHPSNENRVCAILQDMYTKYIHDYPFTKDEITKMSKNINCSFIKDLASSAKPQPA